jgi:hypothetical protein
MEKGKNYFQYMVKSVNKYKDLKIVVCRISYGEAYYKGVTVLKVGVLVKKSSLILVATLVISIPLAECGYLIFLLKKDSLLSSIVFYQNTLNFFIITKS